MKQISLTFGHFSLVDDEDFAKVSTLKWRLLRRGSPNRPILYAMQSAHASALLLHRFIMRPAKGFVVDHINSDGLDNRRSNLRVVTSAENGWNRRFTPTPTNPFHGVHKRDDKWVAQLSVKKQYHYLGTYLSPDDAAKAVSAAITRLRGPAWQMAMPTNAKTEARNA